MSGCWAWPRRSIEISRCSGRDAEGLPPRVLEPDGGASEAAPRVRGPRWEAGRGHKPEGMAELEGSDVRERNKEARLNAKSVDWLRSRITLLLCWCGFQAPLGLYEHAGVRKNQCSSVQIGERGKKWPRSLLLTTHVSLLFSLLPLCCSAPYPRLNTTLATNPPSASAHQCMYTNPLSLSQSKLTTTSRRANPSKRSHSWPRTSGPLSPRRRRQGLEQVAAERGERADAGVVRGLAGGQEAQQLEEHGVRPRQRGRPGLGLGGGCPLVASPFHCVRGGPRYKN